MLAATDKAVGDFEQMLRERNQWDNTLLIVTADNGGETRWGGNNYPLRNWSILSCLDHFCSDLQLDVFLYDRNSRSQKFSLYDGGLRVNSFVSGGLVEKSPHRNSHYDKLFHVSDWHDTILEATECFDSTERTELSGVSHWANLKSGSSRDPRTVLLHNIDPMKPAKGHESRKWVTDLANKYKISIFAQSAVRFDGWKLLTGDPVLNVPGK